MKTRDVKNNIKQTIAFIILQIFLTCNISMSAECLAPSLNVDGEVLSGIFSAISAGKGGGLRLHDLEDKSEFNGDASDVSKKSNVTFIGGVNSGASGIAAANLRFDLLGGDPPNPFDKVEPQNFVQRWFKYWQIRKEKDSREQLENALFADGGYHPSLITALDGNGDGQLTGDELRLEDEASVNAVKARLAATGLTGLQIQGDITPFSINHNVVNGQWATKDCSNCHQQCYRPVPLWTSAQAPPCSKRRCRRSSGFCAWRE